MSAASIPAEASETGVAAAPADEGGARRLRALVRKESRQIIRDPSSILIGFVLPILLLLIFGYGVSLDTARVRMGVVLEDARPAATDLVRSFEASHYFDVVRSFDRASMERELVAGRVRGIVVVPPDFSERLSAGRQPSVQVITDGSQPNTANFVANYARGAISTWMRQRRGLHATEQLAPVSTEPRFWFNPELSSRDNLVPGSIAVVMAIIGTLLTALVIAREWERGTMEALLATPVTRTELLLSKLIPYFILGLLAMALCLLVSAFIFGVPFRGTPFAMLAVSAAFLMPALGQGLLISAATKNQFVASQLALFTGYLPAVLLSGFVFEISSMPAPIRAVTAIIPARFFVESLQTLFLAGDIWPLLLPAIAKMVALGLLFLGATYAVQKKRIA